MTAPDRFTEDMRVRTQSPPNTLDSLREFVSSAPLMIAVVMGIPALVLSIGLLAVLLSAVHVPLAWWTFTTDWWITRIFGGRTYFFGLVLSFGSLPLYWLLAYAYRALMRGRPTIEFPPRRDDKVKPAAGSVLDVDGRTFKSIGIVLAGGGAKGVYQAGALQAIYDFLAANDALGAVQSIAGTSIGSWNALFWLGDLVRSDSGMGGESLMRHWWTSYRVTDLVRPAPNVIPGLSTHLLENGPWKRWFDVLYGPGGPGHDALLGTLGSNSDKRPDLRFYLSRTNIMPGRLAFDTNDYDAVQRTENPTHDIDLARRITSIPMVEQAVFTSMAIPPLFPYANIADSEGSTWCEDGGVVDNLPIRLATAFKPCDLLFVLPLNASFATDRRPSLLPTRLWRVIDVRQGILERAALKSTYLFNIQNALVGTKPIPAFVVAPGQPLRIGTTELWRSIDLRKAVFEQMRCATEELIKSFFVSGGMKAFFDAYDAKKREPETRLIPGGYLRMYTVPSAWEPGAPLGEETRF